MRNIKTEEDPEETDSHEADPLTEEALTEEAETGPVTEEAEIFPEREGETDPGAKAGTRQSSRSPSKTEPEVARGETPLQDQVQKCTTVMFAMT